MQVIGLCRFSYPAFGGFQVEHATIEERRAYLYAAPRMEERFSFFEAITLPSIAAQTDEDFTFVIVIGDDLPAPYHTRLMDLVSSVPQIKVRAYEPGNHRDVMQRAINAERDMEQLCLQFRHDDDDAVAVTFIQNLRETVDDVRPLVARHRLVGFDFNRGFVARPDAIGISAEEQVTPYWGVALAMSVRPFVKQTIMNFGHARLNRFMPTVTLTDEPMYVRGHNDHNDSRQKSHVQPVELSRLDRLGEDLFRETFNICSDNVRRVFRAMPRFPREGE
ncbi:putative rhamnosyl transferase [Primorskyibacter sp. S187A]|uniref:putative rhamnosyl transferase n=1 Tax=Primorskyibacter sp. S187A TaxID=3415130 RepID=UPI003C7C5181